MNTDTATALRPKLAELISVACDRELSARQVADAADSALSALGIGSLALLRLIDGIEDEFGLCVDAAEIFDALDSLSALADWLSTRLEDTR